MKDITGGILFSEEKIIAKNLKAQALGGTISINAPAQLPWHSQNEMRVTGSAKVDALSELLNDGNKDSLNTSLLKQFEGQFKYDGKLSITNNGYKLNLGLQLNELSSQLPAPLNKKLGTAMSGQLLAENISVNGKTEHLATLRIEKLLEAKFAFKNSYETLPEFVKCHSQEMSEQVMRQHIDLYVNDFSIDMGIQGANAIAALEKVYSSFNAAE